jgi:hypothetical protein
VFVKQRNKQGSRASSHKSGGLISVLALGTSACPKNARDLTLNFLVIPPAEDQDFNTCAILGELHIQIITLRLNKNSSDAYNTVPFRLS